MIQAMNPQYRSILCNNRTSVQLSEEIEKMRHEILTEKEVSARTEKELTGDLASTKHALLDIQHQLSMAEKVL